MSEERVYFGTDGIRGRVGEEPITPDFVMRLGCAAGQVLSGEGGGKVLIGKDTRISGYMFESAIEAGLIAAGIDTTLLGPMRDAKCADDKSGARVRRAPRRGLRLRLEVHKARVRDCPHRDANAGRPSARAK